MRQPRARWAPACIGVLLASSAIATAAGVRFEKVVVDRAYRCEGVAVADVNRDGKRDLLAGDVWYAAPDWAMHEVRTPGTYDPAKDRSSCYLNFACDVNGDGWADSIVIGRPGGECLWYENPAGKGGHWKRRVVCKSACNETPRFVDLLDLETIGQVSWITWINVYDFREIKTVYMS